MKGPDFKFIEVFSASNSLIEQIDPHNKNCVTAFNRGTLHALIEISSGLLLLQLHPFMHGVNPNDQVIYDTKDSQYKLTLFVHSNEGENVLIKLNENTQLLLSILSERCKLIERKAANVISSSIRAPTMQIEQTHDDTIDKSKSTSAKLLMASERLGNFLKNTGTKCSQKFEELGNRFAKKVEPGNQVYFSQQTKNLVDKSVKGSNRLLSITQEQFCALFHYAKTESQQLINKTQSGRKIKQTSGYEKLREGVATGLHVIFNVYDGYNEGVSEAITGFGKGSTEVVKAKYGQDAAGVNYDVVHAAKNIYKITKVPKKQLINMFNPKQGNSKNPK